MKKVMAIFIILCIIGCEDDNGENEVTACFTGVAACDTSAEVKVGFFNCSENADSYSWDFGDGTTSNDEEPTHTYAAEGNYNVTLIAANDFHTDTLIQSVHAGCIIAMKPNIYFYPQVNTDLDVSLEFPLGGQIIQSIPDYGNGWTVTVVSNGRIDNTYDYLFYESVQPDIWQTKQGWCIAQDDLESFFNTNMQTWNFNQNEINDFIEYWIPRLTEFDYYAIYPQEKHLIEQVIEMVIVPAPVNLNRLFYLIAGSDEIQTIKIPTVTAFGRDGFTVVEWGVVLK